MMHLNREKPYSRNCADVSDGKLYVSKKADIHYTYGRTNGNGRAALRTYQGQFPDRRMLDHKILQQCTHLPEYHNLVSVTSLGSDEDLIARISEAAAHVREISSIFYAYANRSAKVVKHPHHVIHSFYNKLLLQCPVPLLKVCTRNSRPPCIKQLAGFGDEPRSLEPCSSDEDDNSACELLPLSASIPYTTGRQWYHGSVS
ncbi:hypothetical protein TNCV_3836541 [Trichonephila clavipes]|nr:hypothetical protein TNCV_3836541 [Trichonephila clavipes]